MTLKASTGLRNSILDTGSLKSALETGTGKIYIYAGTAPADADAAIGSATLLVTISDNGGSGSLSFEAAAVAGVLSKLSSQTWSGTNVASGTASFFRWLINGDTNASSTSAKRLQGTVATAGGDLNLSSVGLVSAAPQSIDFFQVGQPSA